MSEYKRKASIAFGIALLCALFAGEVAVREFVKSNAATPWVLSSLALAAAAALALALRFQYLDKRQGKGRRPRGEGT